MQAPPLFLDAVQTTEDASAVVSNAPRMVQMQTPLFVLAAMLVAVMQTPPSLPWPRCGDRVHVGQTPARCVILTLMDHRQSQLVHSSRARTSIHSGPHGLFGMGRWTSRHGTLVRVNLCVAGLDHGALLALRYSGAHFAEPKGRTAHAALAALACGKLAECWPLSLHLACCILCAICMIRCADAKIGCE